MKEFYVYFSPPYSYTIQYLEPPKSFHDEEGSLNGPFKTFTVAKEEAIKMTEIELSQVKYGLSELRKVLKKDFV